jgi:hypothetical protein
MIEISTFVQCSVRAASGSASSRRFFFSGRRAASAAAGGRVFPPCLPRLSVPRLQPSSRPHYFRIPIIDPYSQSPAARARACPTTQHLLSAFKKLQRSNRKLGIARSCPRPRSCLHPLACSCQASTTPASTWPRRPAVDSPRARPHKRSRRRGRQRRRLGSTTRTTRRGDGPRTKRHNKTNKQWASSPSSARSSARSARCAS